MRAFAKVWRTYDEQLDLLESRGFVINDRDAALIDLKSMGYYRLSEYWYPYRLRIPGHREGIDIPSDQVQPGLIFESIVAVCNFDRALRISIWEAIERIENALRVAVAYQHGQKGPFAYLDSSKLDPSCLKRYSKPPHSTPFDEFSQKMKTTFARSREDFVRHFATQYDGRLPIWAAIEVWEFGMLSRFFELLDPGDKKAVSLNFGITNSTTIASWLPALNMLRNFCAHHSRLNRRHFTLIPRFPALAEFEHLKLLSGRQKPRLYPLLCVLAFLINSIAPNSNWRESITLLFDSNPNIDIAEYGIPPSWKAEVLWL